MNSLFLVLSLLLGASLSFAQTVTKVEKNQVQVSTSVEKLEVGEELIFFDANLVESGRGRITKSTPNGNHALVKVISGQVRFGMSFEKTESRGAGKQETERAIPADHERMKYSELSTEERLTLQRGEISDARYIFGGILATYPIGLGIGHAVQGRYSERGWIFTVGELSSIVVMAAGIGNCVDRWSYGNSSCSSGLVLLGAFSYVGFRIWEAIDAWAVPPQQNRNYRELRRRMGESVVSYEPILIPRPDGGALGLLVRF